MESIQPGEVGFASNATFDPDGALVLNTVATGALVRDIYCPDICFIFHTSSLKISKIFTILIIDIIIMLIPIIIITPHALTSPRHDRYDPVRCAETRRRQYLPIVPVME